MHACADVFISVVHLSLSLLSLPDHWLFSLIHPLFSSSFLPHLRVYVLLLILPCSTLCSIFCG
jgi:hypothetical protein